LIGFQGAESNGVYRGSTRNELRILAGFERLWDDELHASQEHPPQGLIRDNRLFLDISNSSTHPEHLNVPDREVRIDPGLARRQHE
jgi:hypothetical protein